MRFKKIHIVPEASDNNKLPKNERSEISTDYHGVPCFEGRK